MPNIPRLQDEQTQRDFIKQSKSSQIKPNGMAPFRFFCAARIIIRHP